MTTLPTLTYLPIPADLHFWRQRETLHLREQLVSPEHVYAKCGILHWCSNNAVVPPYVYRDAFVQCPTGQQVAYLNEQDRFLDEYRKISHEPTAEQRAEARAAHGPGVTLVNVLTGQQWTT